MLAIFALFFSYTDITIDTKSRVLLLSSTPARVDVLNDSVNINLDSIFHPTSLTAGPFSIWVTSRSQTLVQKYSLWGEYLGSMAYNAKDLDVDKNGLLIAGERSLFIDLRTGREIPLTFRETDRCALDEDIIYLYGDDTLYTFERPNRLKIKEYIPGIVDISVLYGELIFLRNDSLITNDTTIFFPSAKRLDARDKQIWILSDSVVSISPKVNE